MSEPHDRHLRADGLREYLDAGKPARIAIPGHPEVWLVVDPMQQRIALRAEWNAGAAPALDGYRHLSFTTGFADAIHYGEFAVKGSTVLLEAYPALCAVADRIQLDGLPIDRAVTEMLAGYHELLRGLGRLSDEEEVGLFGELMALRWLGAGIGVGSALQAWQGPDGEEHDFCLPQLDVEVKCTTSEVRRHWIGSMTQLMPTVGRELYLLSIQLTGAGSGGASLPQLVDTVRDLCAGDDLAKLNDILGRTGWSDVHLPLYRRRYRLRSTPLTYQVDEAFPAITPAQLELAGVPLDRIAALRYLLDVSGFPPAQTPAAFDVPKGFEP